MCVLGKTSSPVLINGHLGGGSMFSSSGVGLVPSQYLSLKMEGKKEKK